MWMGISRDSRHKLRATGGRRKIHQKKRQFELGRPAAMTKIGHRRVHVVRTRGGNSKFRALRLETGNFSWASHAISFKSRIIGVVYNSTNNELVRTNTLVKGCVVQIDAAPFRMYLEKKFHMQLGKKKEGEESFIPANPSQAVKDRIEKLKSSTKFDDKVLDQFSGGRLYAAVSSRPGQCGRADGYILEGQELEFYLRKLQRRKKK